MNLAFDNFAYYEEFRTGAETDALTVSIARSNLVAHPVRDAYAMPNGELVLVDEWGAIFGAVSPKMVGKFGELA